MRKTWTYEECKDQSLKYNRRYDLEKSNRSIYRCIKKNKWEELFGHMNTYLTYEKCKNISILYKNRSDLIKNNCSVYNKITKNKWYELFSHMITTGDRCRRMIYSYEFSDNSCYIGLTYNLEKRNNQHFNINSMKISPVLEHKLLTGLNPVLISKSEYIDVEMAKKMEGEVLDDYKTNGWNILNKSKTGGIGNTLKWTYDKCKEEALKYKTRSELKNNSPSAYNVINRRKWYDLVLHMIVKKKNWTLDDIVEISKGYKKISHFHRDYSGAYRIAEKNGWIEQIRKNMDSPKKRWTFESCRVEALKYDSKKNFQLFSSGSFQAAKKNNWYNEICKHM